MKDNYDILLASDASMGRGWILKGGDYEELSYSTIIDVESVPDEVTINSKKIDRVLRELDEDNFISVNEDDTNEDNAFYKYHYEPWWTLHTKYYFILNM